MNKIQEERAKQLAREHWEYLKQVLETHNIATDIIDIVGFHYKTAFIHGYKHSLEDIEDEYYKQDCDYDDIIKIFGSSLKYNDYYNLMPADRLYGELKDV